MKETIDTTQCPVWFEMEEPEEKKYWTFDADLTFGITTHFIAFIDIERCEIDYMRCLKSSRYKVTSGPYKITRKELIDQAREHNLHRVDIHDKNGQVIESWNVL